MLHSSGFLANYSTRKLQNNKKVCLTLTSVLFNALDDVGRIRFGEILFTMNRYWRSPESAARIGSEVKAFESALPRLLA